MPGGASVHPPGHSVRERVTWFSQSYSQPGWPHSKPPWVDCPHHRPLPVVWAHGSAGQQLSGTLGGATKQPREPQSCVLAVCPL